MLVTKNFINLHPSPGKYLKYYFSKRSSPIEEEKLMTSYQFLCRMEETLKSDQKIFRDEIKADQVVFREELKIFKNEIKADQVVFRGELKDLKNEIKADQKIFKEEMKDFQEGNNNGLIIKLFSAVTFAVGFGTAGANWCGFEIYNRNFSPKVRN